MMFFIGCSSHLNGSHKRGQSLFVPNKDPCHASRRNTYGVDANPVGGVYPNRVAEAGDGGPSRAVEAGGAMRWVGIRPTVLRESLDHMRSPPGQQLTAIWKAKR